jgi:hypothetical protein
MIRPAYYYRTSPFRNRGFFFIDVPPGKVKLLASARNPGYGTCEVHIQLVAGKTVYVDVAPRTENVVAGLAGSIAGVAAVGDTTTIAADAAVATVVGSAVGGAMAQGAESAGKTCGGPYALIQLSEADALRYLDTLAWSQS